MKNYLIVFVLLSMTAYNEGSLFVASNRAITSYSFQNIEKTERADKNAVEVQIVAQGRKVNRFLRKLGYDPAQLQAGVYYIRKGKSKSLSNGYIQEVGE